MAMTPHRPKVLNHFVMQGAVVFQVITALKCLIPAVNGQDVRFECCAVQFPQKIRIRLSGRP